MHVQLLSHVWLLWPHGLEPCPWDFSRQEYWGGLPFPPPGDLPDPDIESVPPASPSLAGGFFTTEPPGKPHLGHAGTYKMVSKYLLTKSTHRYPVLPHFLFFPSTHYVPSQWCFCQKNAWHGTQYRKGFIWWRNCQHLWSFSTLSPRPWPSKTEQILHTTAILMG